MISCTQVIELNRTAYDLMVAPKELVIIEGAGHLFEEPGMLDEVEATPSGGSDIIWLDLPAFNPGLLGLGTPTLKRAAAA